MFSKLEEYVNKIVEYLSMSLLVLMTIIVSWVVFSRYFLHRTPAWGEEGALLCMVWFGFLSIAIGVRDNLHLYITLLEPVFSGKVRLFSDWLVKFLILGFALFMIKEGIKMVEVGTGNYMPGLKLNSAFLYAAIPLAGLAMVYYIISGSIKAVKDERGRK